MTQFIYDNVMYLSQKRSGNSLSSLVSSYSRLHSFDAMRVFDLSADSLHLLFDFSSELIYPNFPISFRKSCRPCMFTLWFRADSSPYFSIPVFISGSGSVSVTSCQYPIKWINYLSLFL